MPLAFRIFLVMALVAAAAVAGAVVLIHLLGERIASDTANRNLNRAATIQEVLSDQRIDQLFLRTQIVAGNSSFVAYLEEGIDRGETLSLVDSLEQNQNELGADMMLLLDPDGRLIASTLELVRDDVDLSGDPLIRDALEAFESAGIWSRGNRVYEAVVVPAATGNILVGFLVSGYEVGEAAVRELKDVTGADATVFVTGADGARMVASTLQASEAEIVAPRIDAETLAAGDAGGPAKTMEVDLEDGPSLAHVSPLLDVARNPVGAVVITDSLAAQRAPFNRLSQRLLAIGLGAILLSLPLSFLLASRISKPIRQLAGAARSAAEGNYDQSVALERRDEIGVMSRAFDVLLSDLRERRDMEHYVAELGRSLPPAGATSPNAGTTLAVATSAMSTIVAVELPRAGRATSLEQTTADAATMLAQESTDVRRAASAIAAHGGEVEAVLGRRILAVFRGADRAPRALAAAAALHAAATGSGAKPPTLALTSGLVVSGPISFDGRRPRPTLTGPGADQAERLLTIAGAGDVVVAQSMFADLDVLLRQSGRSLEESEDFSSALPLFVLPSDLLTLLAGAAMDRTWPGTTTPVSDGRTMQASIGPGQMAAGRYEILGTLGTGGMGVVYRAHDHELDEVVALKMLKPESGIGPEQLERMKLEIKLARKITHANVLRTFDFGDHLGTPFISMEYVPGITLRQLLDQSGRLPLTAGLRLSRQLCRGLEAAHDVGVLHRDIKPENLIVEPSGNAKLMDFGIARTVREDDGQTRRGGIVGTPIYLAPEQIQGDEPDVRADIYATGAVLYEMFTGTMAYTPSTNVMALLQTKVETDPPPPSTQWPEIPSVLEALIVRCLERDREKRFPSASAVLDALSPLRA